MPAHTKIDSSNWKKCKCYIKTADNTWTFAPQVYVKTASNKWTPLYSYSWEAGAWSACNPHCQGTQTRTVRCKSNVFGDYVDDRICTAFAGAKPATSQGCSNPCGLTLSYHWDDHLNTWYKRRSDNVWVNIGINDSSEHVTLSFNPSPSDWPLRMRGDADNSGGHGCGSISDGGGWLTIPGVGRVNVFGYCWGNYGGCSGNLYWRVHANGTVEKLSCNVGEERCANAGYPCCGGEPAW